MTYRIRYRQTGWSRDSEAIIEAHSPSEAMVKFQFAQEARCCNAETQEIITSISSVEDVSWSEL